MDAVETSSNLCHQLLHREIGTSRFHQASSFTSSVYRERFRLAKNLFKTDLRGHFGCVNAIEFSHGGRYLASGGDDKRVLIWDIEKAIATLERPPMRALDTEHTSNIFCLSFDSGNRKILSGGNDDLVIVHDFETGALVNVFKHENPVYGLSIDPQCDSIFATAGEDGQILVFDQRVDPADPFVVAQLRSPFHAVEFHPAGSSFIVTANSKRGAAFWDIRKPHQPVMQYGCVKDSPSCMSVRFNRSGSTILALRRRLPPILYNTQSSEPVCTFYHGNYYNSCTMKSCTFAGEDDEFVLSGSDDFNLYVWRVSDVDMERTDQWIESTQMVLYGHRSIVNQVRYNRQKCLLASSGVEKVVKLWSPFDQKDWSGSLLDEANSSDNPREVYSTYNVSTLPPSPQSWTHMSHDYSSRNTNEDPRMMAFFDSLIQQEIEEWNTSSTTNSPHASIGTGSHSSSNNTSSESSSSDDDDAGDNGGERAPVTRRNKRHVVRKKERQRRTTNIRKAKNKRYKYENRIEYLIATKRNSLRRLAIKGATTSNRRLFKIVNGRRTNKTRRASVGKHHRAMTAKRSSKLSRTNAGPNSPTASSSTAAAAAAGTSHSGFRPQRRKYKETRIYDSSSEDDAESVNVPVASTSTGITSSLKDLMRLRRQQQHILDSDDDDDDDDDDDQRLNNTTGSATVKPLNGIRRDATNSDGPPVIYFDPESVANGSNEQRQSPNTIALETSPLETPPQPATIPTTMLPQTSTNNTNNNNNNNSNHLTRHVGSNSNSRRRPQNELWDNYSSHSNSRLSNSSNQDGINDSSSSASDASTKRQCDDGQGDTEQRSRLNRYKKRKMARLQSSEGVDPSNGNTQLHDGIHLHSINNNNSNNHSSAHAMRIEDERTPIKADPVYCHRSSGSQSHSLNASKRKNAGDRNVASTSTGCGSSHLCTPDSGISVASITPNNDELPHSNGNGIGNVDGIVLNNNENGSAATNLFQQKKSRLRRNYRRKFAEASDSD